ncbi:uncharacterized protein Z520_02965 [Fonsecaea multimorphosa CBS 102226]|uniref:Protein YAE1 n=1 Tax=Fonsecaea multimorphosa CBS 102226 TaxID=1442371 RepID=A0A0D2K6H5_9EURO|nr:uncharacterized protein Z520_02965 [Fonsecaea multimorphosa CBS 102226]KIY01413.1 hypothetical protein Z520_02965 [Fonsecaea multimorphosa CBS 102226]OAL28431.1 hypothetical protein AYO22_02885 [Fonsecaea multimorphosa]
MADAEDRSSPAIPRTGDSPKSTPSPTQSAHSRSSPDTNMTTPERSPEGDDDDDDIWDTSSDHDHDHGHSHNSHAVGQGSTSATQTQPQLSTDASSVHDDPSHRVRREVILSDVPSLRRQHMTDGYREGLSVGKARVMQRGFDAGYPLGVEVGLRVGTVLGVLEGVVSALMAAKTRPRASGGTMEGGSSSATGTTTTTISTTYTSLPSAGESSRGAIDRDEPTTQGSTSSSRKSDGELSFIQNLHARAQRELKISELMKAMDDEKIASIPDASISVSAEAEVDVGVGVEYVGSEDVKNKQAERPPASTVPAEIEAVIEKWEQIVLGSLKEDRIRGTRSKEDATHLEEKD